MRAKKKAPPRRRVSFAVDRDEIEINSDWVDAVMSPVQAAAPRESTIPGEVVPFPAPPGGPAPLARGGEDVFFAAEPKNATGAESTTGEWCTSVEESSAVDQTAPVVDSAAVEDQSSVGKKTTVAVLAPEKEVNGPFTIAYNATVVERTTGVFSATGEVSTSAKDHRLPRPRPIRRVTDGLTPGQYAVYSLMFEAGEGSGDAAHIYKGGYADLGRLTGLSKRGIQNIIAELQAKQVIRIHQHPGYHRSETTGYFVPDAESVLKTWLANGWRHALGKSKTLVP